ncbi:MAG: polyphosphate polymerase domain-containing protein [Erysipelotrichaceae bacterium]|nr:polyphosphate polymerase domain-containing protein [Erysipelotrichaceae bacterium]MBO4538324.1 polyphosphate polymerase domain-containing protein [Erysipelotrichaceae bacterium]MBR5048076.1 polyphosphate polymerase domain-containing protein [Erysipelotrichaceae bacterium]
MVEYRYELKFLISRFTADTLKKQLSQVMRMDSHSISDEYSYDIRSLYFDDPYGSAQDDKRDGNEYRSKYRMRIYNHTYATIKMECKHKHGNMTIKEDCSISRKMADDIIAGRYTSIETERKFLKKFLANAQIRMLRPAVVVDYRRTAFTCPVSSTRITFDEDIRAGRYNLDIFDPDINTLPVCDEVVMEVKCDEFIPAHILAILSSYPKLRLAVSKFAVCSSVK